MADNPSPSATAPSAMRLALVSFVALFHEMLVVRWLSGECLVYGYYANLPLITAFFGLGLGCLLANRKVRLLPAFAPLVALFAILATTPYYREASLVGWTSEQPWAKGLMRGGEFGIAIWYVSFLFLLLVAGAAFVPLGQELGRAFNAMGRPLRAYAVNLAASIAGVWGFALICWELPSAVPWFVVSLVVVLALDRGRSRAVGIACALLALGAVWRADREETWSPYYRIRKTSVTMQAADNGRVEQVGTNLEVNNTYYQRMLDLRETTAKRFPSLQEAADYYNYPYRFCHPASVLVVGAGSGNDVAAALRAGADHVDAVDIDPMIVRFGRDLHPERPYDSPKVNVIVNDARSFFKQTDRKYDLIVFGLLDSHTLVSGIGRLRLDNYVYTEESLREATTHLAPGGVLYLGFTIYKHWVYERFEALFATVFGDKFIVDAQKYDGAGIFVGGGGVGDWLKQAPTQWRHPDVHETAGVLLPTDDWPFLYMENRTVPHEYVIMLAILLVIFAVAGRASLRKGAGWDIRMMLLGAGFLLVEVRGMASLSLLFGATWIVTAIVVTLILAMALAGNALAERWPRPPTAILYAALVGALLLCWAVPSSALLGLDPFARGLLGGLLIALPMAFSGVIFSTALRDHPDPEGALGSNLLGAVVGGVAEYLSTLTGIRALALLAIVFYVGAFLLSRRRSASAPAAAP